MVEATRSKANSNKLEDAIAKLATHQLSLNDSLQHLTHKLNELIQHLPKPDTPNHSPVSSSTTPFPCNLLIP